MGQKVLFGFFPAFFVDHFAIYPSLSCLTLHRLQGQLPPGGRGAQSSLTGTAQRGGQSPSHVQHGLDGWLPLLP